MADMSEKFDISLSVYLLHGRSNKTLYGDVSLIPLPADYHPSVQQLPGTGTGLDKGKTRGPIMCVIRLRSTLDLECLVQLFRKSSRV